MRQRLASQTAQSPRLAEIVASLHVESDWVWAWENYKTVVRSLSEQLNAKRLFEIGAGRGPLFDLDELNNLGAELTVNDISPGELAHLPPSYKAACFDVAGDILGTAQLRGSFDLAFSRMVSSMSPTASELGPISMICWHRAALRWLSSRLFIRFPSSSTGCCQTGWPLQL